MTTTLRIRLTRKLAGMINGVDLSARHVGDIIELPAREAKLLLAEGWARPAEELDELRPPRERRLGPT